MQIKNWDKLQHFNPFTKGRSKPPWIKLYRDILDDHEWHALDGDAAKLLIMIWLLASETQGKVPNDTKKLAFRFRVSEAFVIKHLPALDHWVYQDDITMISTEYHDDAKVVSAGYQVDSQDKDKDKDKEKKHSARKATAYSSIFLEFWKIHPAGPKKSAFEKFLIVEKSGEGMEVILEILKNQVKERESHGGEENFVPRLQDLCRWFSNRRWEDEPIRSKEQALLPGVTKESMEQFFPSGRVSE